MKTRLAAGAALCAAAALLAGCTTSSGGSTAPNATGYPALNVSVNLSALACEPGGACVAAGTNPTSASGTSSIEVSPGGTHRWRSAAVQPLVGVTLSTASCWSAGCLLGGAGPSGTVLVLVNPQTFVSSSLSSRPPGSGIAALSCYGPGQCLALVTGTVSTIAFETTDSGHSWRQISSLPASLQGATSLSCTSLARCVAVGTGPKGASIAWTTTRGRHWHLAAHPGDLQVATSVACVGAICVATARKPDGSAVALRSSDGGSRFAAMSTSVSSPASSTCLDAVTCLVGGAGAAGGALAKISFPAPASATTTTRGARATSTTAPSSSAPTEQTLTLAYVPDPLIALACATPTRCAGITAASTVSIVP